jgi:4a-hydroxytetrahydrobiopterin dehydratase
MADADIEAQLAELTGWRHVDGALERSFAFRDYYDTIAFVNALAWMVHREDHHPELLVQYNRCTVRWSTHSVGGISESDLICAAKTDSVYGRSGN